MSQIIPATDTRQSSLPWGAKRPTTEAQRVLPEVAPGPEQQGNPSTAS